MLREYYYGRLPSIEMTQRAVHEKSIVIHHALFDHAGFGELGFQCGDFLVHIGEDGSDSSLFVTRWQPYSDCCYIALGNYTEGRPAGPLDHLRLECYKEVIQKLIGYSIFAPVLPPEGDAEAEPGKEDGSRLSVSRGVQKLVSNR